MRAKARSAEASTGLVPQILTLRVDELDLKSFVCLFVDVYLLKVESKCQLQSSNQSKPFRANANPRTGLRQPLSTCALHSTSYLMPRSRY